MKNNLKIKIIVGYRKDQFHTIGSDEAAKAYYLFLHPEERGIFKTGLALIGQNIQGIEPDYNATMGWNQTHALDGDDWNQIRKEGVDRALRDALQEAKDIAINEPEKINAPKNDELGEPKNKLIGNE